MIWTQLAGIALALVGVVMSVFPDWFGPLTRSIEPGAELFDVIERRIRGGMVLGLGLLFVARTQLRPWGDSIASLVVYVVLGALLARVFGLMVDGTEGRQWLYVAIEGAILAVAAAWLWRSGSGG